MRFPHSFWQDPNPILFTANFAVLPKGDMSPAAFLAATGLTFARAGDGFTVQDTVNTIKSGLVGVDRPRFGLFGLVLEETRTNSFPNSNDLPAVGGGMNAGLTVTTTPGFAAGPDGVTLAPRSQVLASGYSNYFFNAAGFGISSLWVRQGGAGGPYQAVIGDAGVNTKAVAGVATPTWVKISPNPNYSGWGSTAFVPADGRDWSANGGIVAGARDEVTAWMQLEGLTNSAILFPTEAITTAGVPVTRAPERLSRALGSTLVAPGGRLSLEFKLNPKGSTTPGVAGTISGYAADLYLYADQGSTDAIWIDRASRAAVRVNAMIGGVTVTLPTVMAWNANDTVQIFVAAGGGLPTIGWYAVNGGLAISLGTGAALGAVAPAGAVDLLCRGVANQFSSWVSTITAWKAGKAPKWV